MTYLLPLSIICGLLAGFDRFGQLIGAGSIIAAKNAAQLRFDFIGLLTDHHSAQALGIAPAAVDDPAAGNDPVLDLKIDPCRTGAFSCVVVHGYPP